MKDRTGQKDHKYIIESNFFYLWYYFLLSIMENMNKKIFLGNFFTTDDYVLILIEVLIGNFGWCQDTCSDVMSDSHNYKVLSVNANSPQ